MTRFLPVLLLGLLVGCGSGDAGPALHTVSGDVTFDGTPVEKGSIQFRKTEGDGRAFAGEINNGRYSVQTEAGQMKVEITASRIIPGKFDTSNGTPEPVGEMYIPAKYNTETTLTANIPAGGNSNLPFQLTK